MGLEKSSNNNVTLMWWWHRFREGPRDSATAEAERSELTSDCVSVEQLSFLPASRPRMTLDRYHGSWLLVVAVWYLGGKYSRESRDTGGCDGGVGA